MIAGNMVEEQPVPDWGDRGSLVLADERRLAESEGAALCGKTLLSRAAMAPA